MTDATSLDAGTTEATTSAPGADTAANDAAPATTNEAAVAGSEKPVNGSVATIADAANGDDTGEGTEAGADADWRKEFTGGDEKLMKRISRYASPAGLVKALVAAQDKIAEKTAHAPLPDNATDEQKAEWRKANGIPDKPEGYQLPKINGFDWSDADKEVAQDFFGSAIEANMSQAQAEKVFNWYAGRMQDIQAKQYEADTNARAALEDELRAEWGPEYRQNVKMLARYAEKIPGAGADILAARLPDGRRLGEVPEFVKDLVERARDHYGDSSFIAGDGGSTMQNEKEQIEKIMKTDMNRYRSEGWDKKYLAILQAEERAGSRR